MNNLEKRFASLGVKVPEVLLPKKREDFETWAVIACDQFSSEKAYWEDVRRIVGDKPSAFNCIFPECYLEEKSLDEEVPKINSTMSGYIDSGFFQTLSPGFILVDRKTASGRSRKGIVLAVDLEQYDFTEGSASLIRPTEGTIIERLPPRMKIREGAALDLPHILFLIDDPEGLVIEKAARQMDSMEVVYDFDLMKDGGHVTGRKIDNTDILEALAEGLEELYRRKSLLFAVGDGNHSLASAKSIWKNIKAKGGADVMNHPARWALVEVENIYGEGLDFEPIHRVLFNADAADFFTEMEKTGGCSIISLPGREAVKREMEKEAKGYRIGFFSGESMGVLVIDKPEATLAAEAVQGVLDKYIKNHNEIEIDFIHGEESLISLGTQESNIGFFLPPVDKGSFFTTILKKGALPRKTFSIGEAREKRYYLESRKLIP